MIICDTPTHTQKRMHAVLLASSLAVLIYGKMMIRVLNIVEVWRPLRIMYTTNLVLFWDVNEEISVEIVLLFYKYSQNHLFSR